MPGKMVIPYGKQSISRADIEAVRRAIEGPFITQGPKVKEFEDALQAYTGAKYAVVVSSGTAALHIAAIAAGIKPGREAITSAITFVASANCVLYAGGKPVFADVLEDSVNIDPADMEKKIRKKTCALIPVHFAGRPADLEHIRRIARRNKLIVIEDAAHALGAEYKGRRIGCCEHSDMTIFSFHPVKSITTGEGGAVTTNSKELYKRLLLLRNHGITRDIAHPEGEWQYEMRELGYNYRITDIQCALGLSQLRRLDGFIKRREKIAETYTRELSGIDGLKLPGAGELGKSAWHIYVIRVRTGRKNVFDRLRGAGINVNVHYIPVYTQPFYRSAGYKNVSCPVAEKYYSQAITLPIFPEMKEKEIKYVVKALKGALGVH
ncbi:MAG: UDP-4-amino-4,6-dideoxy-N-acetyl-beta-L-altrosamine transaminase [Candidatus Omnitrophica bacterium]|nr:UDP-4-amino-4,6-dideoxy-N-acetyl-beta-L-altrosamine transaminase [Candidatus Omnitrophota bacterium]